MCETCKWIQHSANKARMELMELLEGLAGGFGSNYIPQNHAELTGLQHIVSSWRLAQVEHNWLFHPPKAVVHEQEEELPW